MKGVWRWVYSATLNALHSKLGQQKHHAMIAYPPNLLANVSSMMRCGCFLQMQYSSCLHNSLQITTPSVQIMNSFYWNPSWLPLRLSPGFPDRRSFDDVVIHWSRWHHQSFLHPIPPLLVLCNFRFKIVGTTIGVSQQVPRGLHWCSYNIHKNHVSFRHRW